MDGTEPLVLIADDDAEMRKLLKVVLNVQYRLIEAESGREAISQVATRTPDIVVLDLGLPDLDGTDVVKELRSWSRVPIIITSSRCDESDIVNALDLGADDYLPKPFRPAELLARIRVSLRHVWQEKSKQVEPVIQIKGLLIDLGSRTVIIDKVEIHLTPIEYRLITYLASHAGKVLTHKQILTEIWGPRNENDIQYLRGYVAALRKKIEKDAEEPKYILTEPGIGYRLAAE